VSDSRSPVTTDNGTINPARAALAHMSDADRDDLEDVFENQVRFEETDMQGIVFYANYVTFQDETVSEYMRQIGYGYGQMEDRGWDIHVVHVDLDYAGQATFDDVVVNSIRVDEIGESSIEWSYAARLKGTEELLAEGGLTHVAVEDGDPIHVPDEFREAVVEFQGVPPGTY